MLVHVLRGISRNFLKRGSAEFSLKKRGNHFNSQGNNYIESSQKRWGGGGVDPTPGLDLPFLYHGHVCEL